jgi:hypothetical protein
VHARSSDAENYLTLCLWQSKDKVCSNHHKESREETEQHYEDVREVDCSCLVLTRSWDSYPSLCQEKMKKMISSDCWSRQGSRSGEENDCRTCKVNSLDETNTSRTSTKRKYFLWKNTRHDTWKREREQELIVRQKRREE